MKRELKKQKAIEIMKELDIYKPYINGFAKSDKVCFYENFGGFWAWQDEELMQKMKEIEDKYNCVVYAITHEFVEFGELYDFLLVPNYEEDLNDLVGKYEKGTHYAFAYVWNKDDDTLSEFGDIVIQSFGGGIKRVG